VTLKPANVEDLAQALADASAKRHKIDRVQLDGLNRILEHSPQDMIATVEAGLTLSAFQNHLAQQGQWLPLDPPHPGHLTIGELLATNASGPRRFGHGTVRDYVIGMTVVLADGRVIKAGGKVVKNVAGYDLCKLFIGSHGSLGVIVDVTFKLKPIPESEQFVQAEFESIDQADAFLEAVLSSELTPVVLDLHNLRPHQALPATCFTVVLGFSGPREDVAYQLRKARELGADKPSTLDYDQQYWTSGAENEVRHLSVLPSALSEAIRQLGAVQFVARAGNGAIWYRGGPEPAKLDLPLKLMKRVKDAYDPNHIFPDWPA
jgi:FAD/FMN-containing dehydrogenase